MPEFFNCHIHTFTANAAPPRFLPFGLLPIARGRFTGPVAGWILRNLWPFSTTDRFERLAAFATIGRLPSQRAVFERVRGFYTDEFRFVVLTLDMDYMGAGVPRHDYQRQLRDVIELRSDPELRDVVLPFVCADPRRPDVAEFVRANIERENGCVGIKVYPPLGFWPSDTRLNPVFDYAASERIPVLAHCSRGGAIYRGRIREEMRVAPHSGKRVGGRRSALFGEYANPDGWLPVLERNPDLRLCLAHYGGGEEWRRYLRNAEPVSERESWIRKINGLIENPQFPHVYADVSATAARPDTLPLIAVLASRPETRDHVLFGSDFFMIQRSTTERQFGLGLRSAIGETAWGRIAGDNVRAWLGSSNSAQRIAGSSTAQPGATPSH